ncbi:MAG TPA: thermonuclease family protein [Vicinamibacterales bacterium]|nr:thermonuclease family protein [Vicinamibacterales bacterium]
MRWLPVPLCALLVGAGPARRAALPDPGQHYAVRYAVDGDTIDVAGIGRVRLLGVDAPEIGAGFDTPAPFAREARQFMSSAVAGRWVRLELDAESHDGYGRLLAYVIRDDGVDVNAALVRAGLARISARYPLRRLSELQAAESDAQSARRGIWGATPSIPAATRYPQPKPRRTGTRRSRKRSGKKTDNASSP